MTGRRSRILPTLSLEHKLPLLMSAVLIVVLATSLALTYGAVRSATLAGAQERLGRSAHQIALLVDAGLNQRLTRLRKLGTDSAVLRAVRDGVGASPREVEAARGVLAKTFTPADSGASLELWDANRRPIVVTRLGAAALEVPGEAPPDGASANPGASASRSDGAMTSAMLQAGQTLYYWAVTPILDAGRRVGYVAQRRQVTRQRAAAQPMRDLLGEDVSFYVRNNSGNVWLSATGKVAAPPLRRDSSNAMLVVTRDRAQQLSVEAPAAAAPWTVVLEAPMGTVLGPAHGALTRLVAFAALVLALGVLLSWLVARRITKPLAALTDNAERVAQGQYDRSVRVSGNDEIARLSASFNRMAGDIAASQRELQQRVSEAQTARDEAERANRAKADFLAVMSHELRTPLNAIAGYSELLGMGVYGPISADQQDALSRIARSQHHLLRLINEVLSFAKIDAGQVQYTIADVPLEAALAELDSMIAPQMRAKGITFVERLCGPAVTVRVDREKLQQIVLNLLENAIKFTPSGGRVSLECNAGGDTALVTVRDTGVGISAEHITSIFDPFVQADRGLSRPHQGVGLGLAIGLDLARAMGGDLTVSSVVGEGSVFALTLPMASSGAGHLLASAPGRISVATK